MCQASRWGTAPPPFKVPQRLEKSSRSNTTTPFPFPHIFEKETEILFTVGECSNHDYDNLDYYY